MLLLLLLSCSGNRKEEKRDTVCRETPAYHADNDIAMTVRSLADAIRIGEPLDSAGYNFEGVLTDGQGHPLYTDVRGVPGVWQVDVTSESSAVIRNIWLGDLLPEDLENYIVESLGISDMDRIDVEDNPVDDATRSVYDFGGGFICIETRTAETETGQNAVLMNIMACKKAPI